MSQFPILVILFVLLPFALSGCASSHYIEKNKDSLQIFLKMPEATSVQFASSVDAHKIHDARQNKSGLWQVTLPLGLEMKYFYIVDGKVYLPECQFKERDDFGSENCLYIP